MQPDKPTNLDEGSDCSEKSKNILEEVTLATFHFKGALRGILPH
jgi:hypothetical protein